MAVKLGLWSLTLIPGETYPIAVRKDFQITNAALGEDLKDNNGRSVIKVTHEPLPAAFFEASDSEDEDDSDIEGDLPSDEFELDSEEGFRKIVKDAAEAAANGDIPAEDDDEDEEFEDDEDEDEDEDDEDMDSDDDDDELLETTVLAALTAGKIEQANLNITFTEGDVVMFEVTGDNAVHLMGNYLEQFPDRYDSDSDSGSDFDSDDQDDYADLDLEDLEDLEDSEDDDVPVKITEINEVSEPKKALKSKAAKVEEKVAPVSEKKRKAEEAGDVSMTSTDGLSKNQKKKLAKKAKTEDAPAPAAAPAPKEKKDIKAGKRTLASGLEYEDVKTGKGPVAKPGKRLSMRYIGKLTNGKQFDSNTAGAPFSFVLGRGEVIKGWDQGLNGMAVGGERKLSIPAQLAYGKQKLPGIPANSTLNFEVKLLSVK